MTFPLLFGSLLSLMVAATHVATASPESPEIEVALRSDKERYHLAEPVQLTVTFENKGTQPIRGYLCAAVWCDATTLLYGRGSAPFVPYGYPPLIVDTETGLKRIEIYYGYFQRTLEPGASVRHELRVVLDGNTDRPVLSSPGKYEFQIHYQDTVEGHDVNLSSNVVRVQATPAPGEAPAAFAAYLRLLRFVQHPVIWNNPSDVPVEFLAAHGGSAYVSVLRRAQLVALTRHVLSGHASRAEQELYRRLKEEFP